MSAHMLELRELRGDPFELLRRVETRLKAARVDAVSGHTLTWVGLGFRLDTLWLVAPREDVREVITLPKTTRVPNALPWLTGIANVRGELLTVVDLRQLLGMPRSEGGRTQRVLVLNSPDVPAGFLVDEVAGHRQFMPEDQRQDLPDSVRSAFGDSLLGGFRRETQDWYALSFHKLALSDSFRQAGV